jgi:hypothetical protein
MEDRIANIRICDKEHRNMRTPAFPPDIIYMPTNLFSKERCQQRHYYRKSNNVGYGDNRCSGLLSPVGGFFQYFGFGYRN